MKKDKKVFNVKKLYRRTFLLIYDIISVIACSYLAILIRYNFELKEIPGHFLAPVNRFLPLNILITILILYLFRMYSSMWVFAGETELQNLVIASVLSTICYRRLDYSFSVSTEDRPYLAVTISFICSC